MYWIERKRWLLLWFFVVTFLGSCTESTRDTEKTRIEERIAKYWGDTKKITLNEEFPTYRIPFLGPPSEKVLTLERRISIEHSETPVAIKMYFSTNGKFLRAESISKIEDPWRKSVETIERIMKGNGESIPDIPQIGENFNFVSFWNGVCKELDMQNATEFDLTFVKYKFSDGTIENVIILNVWGLHNPMGISVNMPEMLKNRVRAFFDLKGHKIAADNLL